MVKGGDFYFDTVLEIFCNETMLKLNPFVQHFYHFSSKVQLTINNVPAFNMMYFAKYRCEMLMTLT